MGQVDSEHPARIQAQCGGWWKGWKGHQHAPDQQGNESQAAKHGTFKKRWQGQWSLPGNGDIAGESEGGGVVVRIPFQVAVGIEDPLAVPEYPEFCQAQAVPVAWN